LLFDIGKMTNVNMLEKCFCYRISIMLVLVRQLGISYS